MYFSKANFIKASAKNIAEAQAMANDTKACATQAKRIYRRHCRGMWKKVQAQARRTLAEAQKFGLTIEKPYFVRDGMVFTMCGLGYVVHAFGGEKISGPYGKLP